MLFIWSSLNTSNFSTFCHRITVQMAFISFFASSLCAVFSFAFFVSQLVSLADQRLRVWVSSSWIIRRLNMRSTIVSLDPMKIKWTDLFQLFKPIEVETILTSCNSSHKNCLRLFCRSPKCQSCEYQINWIRVKIIFSAVCVFVCVVINC